MPGKTAQAYPSRKMQKALHLTEEEALALLELCIYSEKEDNPLRSEVMAKVGELCREFIRPDLLENYNENDRNGSADSELFQCDAPCNTPLDNTPLDRFINRMVQASACA
jgi:hypothetical protein